MVVDRVRRRPTLICVNFLSAALVMLLLFVHNASDVWIIYLTMFLYAFAGNFIGSAQSAFLTTLLPAEQLGDANGFLRTVREGLRLVAPLVGAGLFVVVGGHWIAALDSATFVIAGFTVLALHVREEKPVRSPQRFLPEISAGFHHVARTPILRRMAISLAVAVTVLFGNALIGIVVGSLLLEGGSLALVLAGAVAFGVALPPLLVGAYTLLQLRTPSDLQGRAFSAFDLIASLPQTMSIALGAILITVLGYQGELTIIAAVVSIAALILLLPIAGEPNFGPLVAIEENAVVVH